MVRMAASRRKKAARGTIGKLADVAVAVAVLALVAVIALRLDRVEMRGTTGHPVVNDGDSLTLSGQRIRLRGIDAPEYRQICRKDGEAYPCGRQARSFLAGLIGERPVACRGWERDRYGRLLATCAVGGEDLALRMVEAGWAVSYGDFAAAEAGARQQRIGLWAGDFDRPRDWRQMHGALVEGEHDMLGRIVNALRTLLGWPSAVPDQEAPGEIDEAV
ncbi:MAG: thermonuclease family protein [Rhizobiaceae bacterium]|nr:thermonuclease family protein [Rhizobiaceae bacterium]